MAYSREKSLPIDITATITKMEADSDAVPTRGDGINPRSGFTCVTCRLVFANGDIQRHHYTSEWHRYNAKRHVAALPPITEAQFDSKVKSYEEVRAGGRVAASNARCVRLQTDATVRGARDSAGLYCNVCRKAFRSHNAFDNHIRSKRHQINMVTNAHRGHNVRPRAAVRSDDEAEEATLRKPISAAARQNLKEIRNLRDEDSDSGWETVHSGDEDVYRNGQRIEEEAPAATAESSDEEVVGVDVGVDLGYSLLMPSGAQCGHRDLARYYRQRLRPVADVERQRRGQIEAKIKQKALGWTGTCGTLATAARHATSRQHVCRYARRATRARLSTCQVGLQAAADAHQPAREHALQK